MADLQETMGAVIRRERQARGLTIKTLAERAALSLVYLGEIERGKKYPSARVLEELARALGLEVSDLLEEVALDLRGERQEQVMLPIGFIRPTPAKSPPRNAATPDVQLVLPEAVATMAVMATLQGLSSMHMLKR